MTIPSEPKSDGPKIDAATIRELLGSAVICDALDAEGFRHQSPRVSLRPMTVEGVVVGRCRTTLWADMAHPDPRPYELELAAIDACGPGDMLIAAAGGSIRSGIWGELLSSAAQNSGCVGALVDGAVRDVRRMRGLGFPVFARGTSPYDSKDRQRVIDIDISVEIGGVIFTPGDLVVADLDGVVVIPRAIETAVLERAWEKAQQEDRVRGAIRSGMKVTEMFERFGIL
jgi:4-hydroxy-4-methyl-2-oxoglutarate aldolase